MSLMQAPEKMSLSNYEVLFVRYMYKKTMLEKLQEFLLYVNKKMSDEEKFPEAKIQLYSHDIPHLIISQPGVEYAYVLKFGPDQFVSNWYKNGKFVPDRMMQSPNVSAAYEMFKIDSRQYGFTQNKVV